MNYEGRQTKGKYLTGDVFLAKDGSIGVISSVSYNDAQADPWYCKYSAEKVGEYPLRKNAWWLEDEFSEVLLGPIHQILSGNVRLKLK